MVDRLIFTSQLTFFYWNAFDQEISRIALEYLTKKVKDVAYSIMSEVCYNNVDNYQQHKSCQIESYFSNKFESQ